jgi:hypothetical protein
LAFYCYWLIDEKAYADHPPQPENLASALFLLETQPPNNLLDLLDLFRDTLQLRQPEARVLGHWLQWNLFDRKGIQAPQHFSLTEKRDMLAALIDREYAQRGAMGAYQAKLAIARKLLARGWSVADIAQDTGLTEAEIKRLIEAK